MHEINFCLNLCVPKKGLRNARGMNVVGEFGNGLVLPMAAITAPLHAIYASRPILDGKPLQTEDLDTEEKLDALKNKLGISDQIFNLGHRNDVSAILKGLDIFVLPSIEPDPFPTTVLEAMGHGKAIAATNHGGVPEMIENEISGILIPWDNPEEAATRIGRIISDSALREKYGINARNRAVSLFNQSEFEGKIISILSRIT